MIHVFTDVYLKVTLVYLLAVNVIVSPKRLERLTWILVFAVGYIAFRAVLDDVRGVNLIAKGTRVMGSTNSRRRRTRSKSFTTRWKRAR